ncbi:efflux RND transporter periplasmic adaptor subunit [Sphingobium nicotianae]|uniref:HlyD family efflux transporter periplasmic adaptor subunit n=1 Tax=Sphingobium nicotianae TaxID=2782607 RepID=A0A9X1DEB6_9SPHN|nr:HlyD family efflux transporter periplasmic adaptor subunit [Sphingobium nicotianae]MBT2188346.1 HlyD family efflux transporter periplasmic adaptor subunit [Sphingobium nicotianae]
MGRTFITGPRIVVALIVIVVAIAIVFATRTPAIEVEEGIVARGPMTVTVDDLAETRVRDLYTVSAPIAGALRRVPLKPGDKVVAGKTLLATIQPAEPAALDARTLAQVKADIRLFDAQTAAARAQVRDSQAALKLTERQLARTAALRESGYVAQARLDEAEAARDRARASVQAAREAEHAASESANAARAGLISPGTGAPAGAPVAVHSPVSGYVLTVPQESERTVLAGTPLVTVGDPERLEMVTDLLSADAVRVRPGAAVSIEDWGGDRALKGYVRLIEPYGFLKVSALGVEEQRVNVIIGFVQPREAWARLGHGFRATVRIAIWSSPDVALVPLGALFRNGAEWNVFRVVAGRAEPVTVRVGRINNEMAQVLGGLAPGDRVILHPGDKVGKDVKVRVAANH